MNRRGRAYLTLLMISIVAQFVFTMNLIHPIQVKPLITLPKQEHSTAKVTNKKVMAKTYTPCVSDASADMSLQSIVTAYQTSTVSTDSIVIPEDVEVKSVSANDYKPGTYKFIPNNKEIGTIVIYSNGHVTVLKPDGIHTDYPAMTLSSDSLYASDIKVQLKHQ